MSIEQPRCVDYVKPVSLTQTDLHTKLQIVVRNYNKLDADDNNSPFKYTSQTLVIHMKAVKSIYSLDFDPDSKTYSASLPRPLFLSQNHQTRVAIDIPPRQHGVQMKLTLLEWCQLWSRQPPEHGPKDTDPSVYSLISDPWILKTVSWSLYLFFNVVLRRFFILQNGNWQ